jgi:hypothetical protein
MSDVPFEDVLENKPAPDAQPEEVVEELPEDVDDDEVIEPTETEKVFGEGFVTIREERMENGDLEMILAHKDANVLQDPMIRTRVYNYLRNKYNAGKVGYNKDQPTIVDMGGEQWPGRFIKLKTLP